MNAADRARLAALEARVAAGGAGGGPGAGSEDVEALRAELAALREQVETLQTDLEDTQTGADDTMKEAARRLTFSGYAATYLEARQKRDPFFRASRVNLLGNAQVAETFRYHMEIELEDAVAVGESGGVLELGAGAQADRRGRLELEEGLLQLEYIVGVFNGLDDGIVSEVAGRNGLRDARPRFDGDNNPGKAFMGRVALLVGEALTAGVSGYWGPYETGGGAAIAMGGADALLKVGGLKVRTEGMLIKIQDGFVPYDHDDDPTTPSLESHCPATMAGAVVELEYDAFPAFLRETAFGAFDDPNLFFAGRVDFITHVYASGHHPSELVVGGSVGYRPVHRSAIRIEYQRGVSGADGGIGLDDDWRFTLAFAMGY